MNIALVEPLVKFPIKINKNGEIGDVCTRQSLGFLAGYITDYSHFNVQLIPYRLEEIERKERNLEQDLSDFDIIGITASTTEIPDAMRIAHVAKSFGKKVVLGGIFPTNNARYLLKSNDIDFIVRGEGEKTLLELLKALESNRDFSKIDGLSYKSNGEIKENPKRVITNDVNIFRSAIDFRHLERYAKITDRATIYSARGCYHKCSFCSLNQLWDYKHRKRSINKILDELEIYKKAGINKVQIDDESILLDKNFGIALFWGIIERELTMKYHVKVRLDEIDEQSLETMKESGVDEIHFGIETPNQTGLNMIRKGVIFRKQEAKIALMESMEFTLNPSFMLGLPGDTELDIITCSDYIINFQENHVKTNIYVSMYTVHPENGSYVSARESRVRGVNPDLDCYTHWMLTNIPHSLGDPFDALYLLEREQNRIIKSLNNPEPLVCAKSVLEVNPKLLPLAKLPDIDTLKYY